MFKKNQKLFYPHSLGAVSGLTLGVTFQFFVSLETQGEVPAVLEEIVVTATKHETSLMKTPIAVTAISQESLTRQGVKDLRDISGLIPNVQLGLSPADSGVQASVRGVTSTNFTEIGDPSVGIHIDGIYSPRPQGSLALMFDLEQVEALRGPQGTLFGRNSAGGTINIIPRKPRLEETEVSAYADFGNYNHRQYRGILNLPVGDTFAVRGTFMVDTRDGYIDQTSDLTDRAIPAADVWSSGNPSRPADGIADVDQRFNRPVGKEDYYTNSDKYAMRITARWQPLENLDWNFGYEKFQDNGAGDLLFKDCDDARGTAWACDYDHWSAAINVPGDMDMTIQTYRSNLAWALSDTMVLEYRLGFAVQERAQQHDDDGGFQHPLAERVVGGWGAWHVDDRATFTLDSNYKTTVHELQLKQNIGALRYVAGAFWMHEDNQIRFAQNSMVTAPDGFPIGQYYNQPDRQVDAKALFAQADWELVENWTLTLGYRQSRDEKDDKNGQTFGNWSGDGWYYNGDFDPVTEGRSHNSTDLTDNMGWQGFVDSYPDPTVNTHADDWSKGTYRLGLQYDIDAAQMVFASLSTGYKAGGFGDKFDLCGGGSCLDGSTEQFSYLDYDPEEVTSYELGYKGALLDGGINVSATFFFMDYDNMQVTGMTNVGQKQISGVCPDWDPTCDMVQAWKTENIGESEIKGLELEFDAIPWEGGRVGGYIAWLDATVKDYKTYSDDLFCGERDTFDMEPCAPVYQGDDPDLRGRRAYDVTGNQLPYSPEFSASLSYSHAIVLSSGFEIIPWVSVRWQDDMYFSVRNLDNRHLNDKLNSYTNVDATVKLVSPDGGWYVEAYGANLTDNIVMNWFGAGGSFKTGSFNPPRMYGMRLSYDF